ncbi:MAG: hypothetical protein Q9M25_08580 [Mariprofundaceae bacterium]|nr:hypothetical protein [Mariprofundaceae bacterium]
MMKKTAMSLVIAGIVGITPVFASGDHADMAAHHEMMNGTMNHQSGHEMGKGHMHGMTMGEMTHSMDGMFLLRKDIDGYQVSFHVMKAPEGMQKHGGTYHFMFKAEKDGKALTNMRVNSKITHPDGHSESKMMMKMGDWYMAGYNFDHKGRHQVMVLFKTADGIKHFGGVDYPEKGKE